MSGLLELSGVLPDHLIEEAVERGWITAGDFRIRDEQVQPASLDLSLGDTAYRLRCSFVPDQSAVEEKIKDLIIDTVDLRRGGVLEHNLPYVVQLRERVALPDEVRAKANPKSSTGRLDVFTRVLTDGSYKFDEVEPGYHGPLWLEIVPMSFPIRVQQGLALNQLRLVVGTPAALTDAEIAAEHADGPGLLFVDSEKVSIDELATNRGLFLSLDLRPDEHGSVGFRSRSHTTLLDLTAGAVDRAAFWDEVRAEAGNRIVLEPEEFYLLLSHEAVRIPPHLASEMVAFDPTSGELRTHYAGFFDPGFGHGPDGRHGSRAALEVRAHDVAFQIEHRQRVCKLSFERMAAVPVRLYGASELSHYQGQDSTLSKYFLGA